MADAPTVVPPAEVDDPVALRAQLDELKKHDQKRERELMTAKLETAKVRALKDFPSVDEEILALYSGGPDGLYDYAKKIHEKFSVAAPPATPPSPPPAGPPRAGSHAPAPAPGPGQQIPPEQADTMRLRELRDKANSGMMAVKSRANNEAQEYYERGLGDGLRRHFGQVKAR
jgi:hypothetical protein